MAKTRLDEPEMARKTTPVRISAEAIRWARIASGYTGESMADYVSRIVEERSKEDAARLHTEATSGDEPTPKRVPTKPK